MAVKFTNEPCKKSKRNRPCVLKFVKTHLIGEGERKTIQQCRRCLEMHITTEDATKLECPLSSSGKHQWKWVKTLAFKQHWRHQEKTVNEKCPQCKAERVRTYNSLIGYNPHHKKEGN